MRHQHGRLPVAQLGGRAPPRRVADDGGSCLIAPSHDDIATATAIANATHAIANATHAIATATHAVPRTSPPRRREALRYWRDGADGLCKLATREETVEQRCVRHVKTRWPRRVDVVHSRVFNSLYLQYTSAVPPSTAEAGCFGDGGEGRHLVCHMMGMPPPLRLAVFGRERDARRAELRGLLAQRAERYVSLSGDG